MLLKSYERIKFNEYVKPLFIKDKCELCGEILELELHHSKPFSELLNECLLSLGYEYHKNKKYYTELQLQNITNWMIGVQMKIGYRTLCGKCHALSHDIGGI